MCPGSCPGVPVPLVAWCMVSRCPGVTVSRCPGVPVAIGMVNSVLGKF